ncbi:MAG: 2-hydroxy-3-oxopropionate reductase [Alphaproteobacteria bacterium MarineAlpha9_Bin4]|nr:oxidoreductase [Pelagibacterales bacterium]PPR27592.1 MAG: 2-hydroxy-3-oxopropionate reductase [Alphaproteobacteria bacterium MarineAlpha9_Bin4]|tara:strand:- start:220 stop:1089 length:870 start_codon:yes stop_codon:yes gene_type:complete
MKVSFIGLGVMGYPMAGHLSNNNSNIELKVYNRTTEKTKKWLNEYKGTFSKTPAEAAKDCDIVFLCVGNDNDVNQVVQGENGVLKSIPKNSIIVDHTTASAKIAINLHQICQNQKKVSFLDAPVSGGQAGAENGKLTIMIGGDEASYNKVLPFLNNYAKNTSLIGKSGSGQLAKMVNQICIAGLLQGLSEAINFAQKVDLDVEKVISVIKDGAASSWQMENRYKTMTKDQFDFGFAVEWMRKDLKICLEQADKVGARLPVTAIIDQFYSNILNNGGRRWDTSSLIKLLR